MGHDGPMITYRMSAGDMYAGGGQFLCFWEPAMPRKVSDRGFTQRGYEAVFRAARQGGATALSVKRRASTTEIVVYWDDAYRDLDRTGQITFIFDEGDHGEQGGQTIRLRSIDDLLKLLEQRPSLFLGH
jgi:hypothetical protein